MVSAGPAPPLSFRLRRGVARLRLVDRGLRLRAVLVLDGGVAIVARLPRE